MVNSETLKKLISKFENYSDDQIMEIAQESINSFIEKNNLEDDKIVMLMMLSARLGFSSKKGVLNSDEKDMASSVFGGILQVSEQEIYDVVSPKLNLGELDFLTSIDASCDCMDLIKFILSFAYIDGKMDNSIAENLERCFKKTLNKFDGNEKSRNSSSGLSSKEKTVLDCVRRLDDGKGSTANLYYSLYGSWDLPDFPEDLNRDNLTAYMKAVENNSNQINMSESEFTDIMNLLAKKGLIYKNENGLFYSRKPDGSVFEQLQETIQRGTEEQIIGTAIDSINSFIANSGMQSSQRIFEALILGAKVGIASKNGILNKSEKRIANEIFKSIWKGDMSEIYDMLGQRIRDEEYMVLKMAGSNRIGFDYLKYIMCFAYIDKKWDTVVAKKVEECFGMALLGLVINGVTYN